MDGDKCEKWFSEQLLPNCPKNAVIVLDNASYHTRRVEPIPTSSWRKADVMKWVIDHGISVSDDLLKRELLHIVNENKEKYLKYVIDEMVRKAGLQLLRLPPYHCELNPIEMVWSQLKHFIKMNNTTFKKDEVLKLITKGYELISPSNWSNYIKHVKEIELRMWEADCLLDDVDQLVINLSSSSTSSSEECSEGSMEVNIEAGTSGTTKFIPGIEPLPSSDSD